MPDLDQLFDTLREPTSSGDAGAARARGDRLRRRRTATAVAGGALAVALVAGGVGWGQAGLTRTGPDPAAPRPAGPTQTTPPSDSGPYPESEGYPGSPGSPALSPTDPAQGWRTELPADLPLTLDLPDVGSDGEQLGPAADVAAFDGERVCQSNAVFAFESSSRLAVRLSVPERLHQRVVMTFESDRAAREAMNRVVGEYSRCPRVGNGDGTVSLNRVTPMRLGDESSLVVRRQEVDGELGLGLRTLIVARVGNALLLTGLDSEALGERAAVEDQVGTLRGPAAVLVEQMCVFSIDPC